MTARSSSSEDPPVPELNPKHDANPTVSHNEDISSIMAMKEATAGTSSPISDDSDFEWSLGIITNLMALMGCYLASTWGLVVPSSSIGFIVHQYPSGAAKAVWIAAAITIPNCVLQSFIGDLSDFLGRKIFLLIGCILGLVGMLVASRANSIEMVIGGQVLNGCGLTLGYLAIPLVSEIVPKNARVAINGVAAIFAGFSTSLGPIIQGAFITHQLGGSANGWRAGFYLGACLYALAFAMVLVFYKPLPRPNPDGLSITSKLARFDWFGIFLVTAGLTLFLLGLQYGGEYPWKSTMVLCPLIIGGVCLVVFVIWEWKGTSHGLFDHSLFTHSNYATCLVISAVGGIVLFGGQAYLPQEILYLFTSDAILTGVYNLPFNLLSTGGAIIAAVLVGVLKEGKWVVVGAQTVLVIGSGLMAVMQPHISFAAWFFPTALLGTSVGIQMTLIITITSLCTPDHLIAAAISTNSSIRALGGSIGVVIFGQIFQSKIKVKLVDGVSGVLLASGVVPQNIVTFMEAFAESNTDAMMEVPGVTESVLKAVDSASKQAYADSFRFVWYSLVPFAVIALALSLLLKPIRHQLTRQVVSGVENAKH